MALEEELLEDIDGPATGDGARAGLSDSEMELLRGIQSGSAQATATTPQEQADGPAVAGTAGRNPGAEHAKLTGRGPGRAAKKRTAGSRLPED